MGYEVEIDHSKVDTNTSPKKGFYGKGCWMSIDSPGRIVFAPAMLLRVAEKTSMFINANNLVGLNMLVLFSETALTVGFV